MKKTLQSAGRVLLAMGLVGSAQAATIDLTQGGTANGINGVIFSTTEIQPTGTGVIDPFLRLQNTPSEVGINTSLDTPNQPILNDKPGIWTHDLALSTLQQVTVAGHGSTLYYKFLLDINQTASSPLLNLNTISFYVRSSAFNSLSSFLNAFNITGSNNENLGALPSGTVSALAAGDSVLLNYNLNSGSGSGDMFMYVPVNLLGTSGYLYLINQNGAPPGLNASNDGFEEWAGQTGPAVPDASTTLTMLGMALVGIEGVRRKLLA